MLFLAHFPFVVNRARADRAVATSARDREITEIASHRTLRRRGKQTDRKFIWCLKKSDIRAIGAPRQSTHHGPCWLASLEEEEDDARSITVPRPSSSSSSFMRSSTWPKRAKTSSHTKRKSVPLCHAWIRSGFDRDWQARIRSGFYLISSLTLRPRIKTYDANALFSLEQVLAKKKQVSAPK